MSTEFASMEPWEVAVAYHGRTKHHFRRYAAALGYLDWATQPDPFRRYAGATLHPLQLTQAADATPYDDLFTAGAIAPRPVALGSISALFEFSLALSAWKQFKDSRWALRINPSSGNLHPTEGYLIAGAVDGLYEKPAVYHYAPKEHALERRTEFEQQVWNRLSAGLPSGAFLIALTSIHWREAWKYGERAYRYCQHDAGHAIAAVALSAALQGWQTFLLRGASDEDIEALLGLDRESDYGEAEREAPDALLAVVPTPVGEALHARTLERVAINEVAKGTWTGQANRLSSDHVHWDIIDTAAEACRKGVFATTMESRASFGSPIAVRRSQVAAQRIIRQRRSAVSFDGVTSITAEQFFFMLDRVLPRGDRPPWQTLGPPVCIHLALFVHRVTGVPPGLYFLVRRPDCRDDLQRSTHASFDWTKPEGCPHGLPLYRLQEGDARQVAGQISCGQDIAADSAFSLGMIAEFEEPLRTFGAWFYRRLHWEAGAVGQVLYLEAEAAGVRATGIGCFFDDPMHDLLGLKGHRYQTLYHFTVGGQVDDLRLMSWPPYPLETREAISEPR